jgi:hypothetical protein
MTEEPIQVAPGSSCPHPDTLRTGDLLFARAPGDGRCPGPAGERGVAPWLAMLQLRPRSTHRSTPARPQRPHPDGWGGSLLRGDARVAHRLRAPLVKHGAADPQDLLLKVLHAEFGASLRSWFDLDVDRFVRHPVAQFLMDALRSELGAGLFVGHMAMVVREPGGLLMVHESNITDFSAYETRAKRYIDPADPRPAAGNACRMHGWLGYRHAMGNMVWAARPAALARLDAGDPQGAEQVRDAIRLQAKRLSGIPYGCLDHPDPGNAQRLYCSEFVLVVLRAVADQLGIEFGVEDTGSWRWFVDHLRDAGLQQRLRAVLAHDGLWQRLQQRRFFLYTVQMAWCSAGVQPFFTPAGEGGYA